MLEVPSKKSTIFQRIKKNFNHNLTQINAQTPEELSILNYQNPWHILRPGNKRPHR